MKEEENVYRDIYKITERHKIDNLFRLYVAKILVRQTSGAHFCHECGNNVCRRCIRSFLLLFIQFHALLFIPYVFPPLSAFTDPDNNFVLLCRSYNHSNTFFSAKPQFCVCVCRNACMRQINERFIYRKLVKQY